MQAHKTGYPTVRKVSGATWDALGWLLALQLLFLGVSWGTQFGQLHLLSCLQSARELSQLINLLPISTNTVASSLFPSETVKQIPTIFSPVLNSQLWTQSHYQLLLFSCLCFLIMPSYFLSRGHNSPCIFLFISLSARSKWNGQQNLIFFVLCWTNNI